MERAQAEDVLELLTSRSLDVNATPPDRKVSLDGVVRGVISEFDHATGRIQIVVPRLSIFEPMLTRSVVPITHADVGREVLVAFEAGGATCPYIIGLLWNPGQNPPTQAEPIEAKVDGEQVVIEGKKEIVLKCGKASIILTRAGKVLIRGAYVLSRSSGVNRMKGGSVQVN